MKRTISLVIGIFISFLMMFSSVAMADEMKVATPVTPSELTKSEVVKVTPTETKQTSVSQPKASDIVDKGEMNPIKLKPECNVPCPGGAGGYISYGYCIPC
ncbi:MAG: hypothetical protein KME28_15145 [Pelatocladus maniniholoensis HA4357-MV3]|uniref:Uncharacterized protein n=1 Tax=Pelatocladus maniniholoensis HA4357-MV3 TaxID=1117104 RepID=A0A9E3H989_9NOST|nr:hypothetical protein [Pelatocladus maniniholoensis HA4357-MV3]BAZ67030.1 hypothetical protein NIES4106_17830 [Fischerella sp. NIES-4106]